MKRIETKTFASHGLQSLVDQINNFVDGRIAEIEDVQRIGDYFCVVHILAEEAPEVTIKTQWIWKDGSTHDEPEAEPEDNAPLPYIPIYPVYPNYPFQPQPWTPDPLNPVYVGDPPSWQQPTVTCSTSTNAMDASLFPSEEYVFPTEEYKPEEEKEASIESITPPTGYSAIVRTYGQPMTYGELSESWYRSNIVSVELPFKMKLAWDTSKTVQHVAIHKRIAHIFLKTLTDVYNYARVEVKKAYGYDKTTQFYNEKALEYLRKHNLDLYGGTYCFRMKRGSNSLSLHSFGIAIDIDPAHNAMGTQGTLPNWYVKIWEDRGWTWGGRWSGRNCDPMHFQYAKGA